MDQAVADRIKERPEFHQLVSQRSRLARKLSALMLTIYFAFIILVAFAPGLLGTPIGESIVTIGIPVGIGIIFIAFALTGIYVHRANTEFDSLNHTVRKHIEGME